MIKIKIPATSANLGPGFDTLGLALDIYNEFCFEKYDKLIIENVEEKYQNEDNLLIQAYKKTLARRNISSGLYVKFNTSIPISRGLGSSSSLVVAGVFAANELHNLGLSVEEMFQICNDIEGHPDNVAPCLFGGFVTSVVDNGRAYAKKISISDKFYFTVMIPDFELKTSEAREVMPSTIKLKDAIFSMSRAISLCLALQDGDEKHLKIFLQDKIHEPYRKDLIKDFDRLKEAVIEKGALGMVISGSGSTCLTISTDPNFSKRLDLDNLNLKNMWRLVDCKVHMEEIKVEKV